MSEHSSIDAETKRAKLIGIGERSIRKTYYPELQRRLTDLERFRVLLDSASDAIFLIDIASGRIVDANLTACRLIGRSREKTLGLALNDFLPARLVRQWRDRTRSWEGSGPATPELIQASLHLPGGRKAFLEISLTRHTFGSTRYAVAVTRDVTERRCMEDKLRHMALHDPLTGLANRTMLRDRISHAMEYAKRQANYLCALLFIDLDRFKTVNDSLGHSAGDKLLAEVGMRLPTCVRAHDTVCRYGGDEFVILLERLPSLRNAITISRRVQKELGVPFQIGHHVISVSASIGVELYPCESTNSDDAIRSANIAMHHAKDKKRGSIKVFTPRLLETTMVTRALEHDLDRAIQHGDIYPVFQPIMNLRDGASLQGFEALARWDHPERGSIPPCTFIPIAEETGKIVPLGGLIMRRACEVLAEWNRLDPANRDLIMSINVSPKQFFSIDLTRTLRQILEVEDILPGQIRLEITESTLAKNDLASERIREIRQLGVRVGLDDFGTGYSSMALLSQLPLDNMKIDLSFIQEIESKPENVPIVRAIITMAASLNLEVIAEGVETEMQRDLLLGFGCPIHQGFLYAKPLTAAKAARFIIEARGVQKAG